MGFLNKNESIILMDRNSYGNFSNRLCKKDFLMLRDAGIQTVMYCATDWAAIEPQKGVYNWGPLDNRMQLLKDCGMKVLVHSCMTIPTWLPANWQSRHKNGESAKCWESQIPMPSIWCKEAMEYVNQYYIKIKDRYNSNDSMVIDSWLEYGERFIVEESWFDEHATKDYYEKFGMTSTNDDYTEDWINDAIIDMMTEHAKILIQNKWKELWIMGNIEFLKPKRKICVPSLLESYTNLGATINHLYYTWSVPKFWSQINHYGRVFDENVFGGAENFTGINDTTDLAILQGLRGLLIEPCHFLDNHTKIDDQICDKIKKANDKWVIHWKNEFKSRIKIFV